MLVHAPIQYRLINGESINTEGDERTFNTIQNLTKGKTNYRPGHLIGNMIVRHEYSTQNKTLFEYERDLNQFQNKKKENDYKLQQALFTVDQKTSKIKDLIDEIKTLKNRQFESN